MKKDDKKRAIESLKVLHGLPPHDTWSNICYGDGYYANSIKRDFGMSISELSQECGFDKIHAKYIKKREKLRKEFS